MRLLFSAAFAGAALIAAPAMAWENNMTQPAGSDMVVYAYPTKANYCPAGLQPVVVGGVICCGQATHTNYQSHPPAPKRRKATRPAATYVSYGKGYGETMVYEKGQ